MFRLGLCESASRHYERASLISKSVASSISVRAVLLRACRKGVEVADFVKLGFQDVCQSIGSAEILKGFRRFVQFEHQFFFAFTLTILNI